MTCTPTSERRAEFEAFMSEHMREIPVALLDGWDDSTRWTPHSPKVAEVGEMLIDELNDKRSGAAGELPAEKQTVFILLRCRDSSPYVMLSQRQVPEGYEPDGHEEYREYGKVPYYFDQDEADVVAERINAVEARKAKRRWMYNHAMMPSDQVTNEMLHQAGISVSTYATWDGGSQRLAGVDGAGYSFDEYHFYPLFALWLSQKSNSP
jgi:hypothetical protein